jgi:phosphatidylserine/phosphatidylglycerophosphate/cardiolipin synthase-like enzyme
VTKVEILGTGSEFMKKGIRGTEPVIEEIIMQASKEIQILAYVFTAKASHILNLVEQAAKRGLKITIIVNDLKAQDQIIKSKLENMEATFPYVNVLNFTDNTKRQLHAKIVVADREKAVIGSANLSWGGMYSNYEIGLLVEGEPAWKIAQLVDSLKTELSWH